MAALDGTAKVRSGPRPKAAVGLINANGGKVPQLRHRTRLRRTTGLDFGFLTHGECPVWGIPATVPRNRCALDQVSPANCAADASGGFVLCGWLLQSKTFLKQLAICQIRSCVRPVGAEPKPAGLDGFRRSSPHSRTRTVVVLDKARGVLILRLTCPPSLRWSCYLLVRFRLFVPRRVYCASALPR